MWKNFFLVGIFLVVPVFFVALFLSSAWAKRRSRGAKTLPPQRESEGQSAQKGE